MAGLKGYSGRRKLPGRVHRLELYYRFRPGDDPSEIEEVFDLIRQHRGAARRAILRALFSAGADAARRAAWQFQDEGPDVGQLIDEMITDF